MIRASEHKQARRPLPRKLIFCDEMRCSIEILFRRPESTNDSKTLRPTMSDVKREAKMQKVSAIAKPLTGPLALKNKMSAVINVVTLTTKIELKPFAYADCMAILR